MRPDIHEALRYLGITNPTEELRWGTRILADELADFLQPQYVYRVFEIEHLPDRVRLPEAGLDLTSSSARTMLEGCHKAVLLACTLGKRFSMKMLVLKSRDMEKAVIVDALGSSFVETGCDQAEREISRRFPELYLTDRFSPGYGDLPLSLQPQLCAVLDAERRLGITVTQSLLMLPVKSVTAVIGLSETPRPARIRGCAFCSLKETCQFRKEGRTCGA